MTDTPLVFTREQVREIDRRAIEDFGLPGIVLMENAGRGCCQLLLDAGVKGTVVICCGRGNNGGDGYVIARHLENAGVDVRVLLFADRVKVRGDARVNLDVLRKSGTPLHEVREPTAVEVDRLLDGADWIVDGLLGTGTRGEIREPFTTAVAAINRANARRFAVDLPSGLDADRGVPLESCVVADVTGTFVGWKPGFRNPAAAGYLGTVHVIDIGVPRQLLTSPAGR